MDKRIRICDTELYVFPIGLGTVNAGLRWDGKEADALFATYLSYGGNLVDSAHVYSDWVPGERARAERVVGDWLKRSGRRNEIVLCTKGGHPEMAGADVDLHRSRMSHEDMVKDLNESLLRLGCDHIDLYFYHRDDIRIPVEETIETMEEFVRAGKIRYYGCSNWSAGRMKEADDYCARKGYRGFVADQSLLNVGMRYFRGPEDDTLSCTRGEEWNYHVENPRNLEMAYSATCGGYFHLLAGKGEAGVRGSIYDTPGNRKLAERLQELCGRYGCTITQAVLGFFFHLPFTCVPLCGPGTPEHVTDACRTPEVAFTDEDYAGLFAE